MQRMSERERRQGDEASADRPSSFREILYRDRRLLSRRQMDRRLRDRAAERDRAAGNDDDKYVTYFPALRRIFTGDPMSEALAVAAVIVLLIASFLFGYWLG